MRLVRALACCFTVLVAVSTAYAQPASDESLARDAYVLGSELAKQGQWADALAAYQRSMTLRPHATTQFNVGYVQRALGRSVEARASLRAALERHAAHSTEMDAALIQEARGYLAELDQKIPKVRMRLSPAGSSAWIDGRPVVPESKGSAYVVSKETETGHALPESFELLVDPGRHELRIEAPDGRTKSVRFEAAVAERLNLAVALAPIEHSDQPPPHRVDYGWPIALTGLGVATLAVGAFAGVAAFAKDDDLAEACPAPQDCAREYQVDIDALDTYATASTASFIIGGAILAAGMAWITVTAVSSPDGDAVVSVGPRGLRFEGRF